MIVTSKRVFINVLAQFMTFKDLMSATYFIPDVNNSAASRMHFDKQVKYHDDGSFEIINKPMVSSGISRFNIVYGDGWLDPTWAINQTTSLSIGLDADKRRHQLEDPLKVYVDRLKDPNTIIGVRDWLYGRLSNHNPNMGMRIIIINDEDIVRQFGHTICMYLSTYFGENITFLDPKYRPQIVHGQVSYQGNKEFSRKLLKDLQDYDLIVKVHGLISQSGYDMSLNNLKAFLSTMEVPKLFYVYEQLFPYEPLPAGNYSKEQIITIIAGKAAEKVGVVYDVTERSSALSTINQYMDQIDAMLDNG